MKNIGSESVVVIKCIPSEPVIPEFLSFGRVVGYTMFSPSSPYLNL